MRVALGTFACTGVEENLGSDVPAGVGAALAEYVRLVESGVRPIGIPHFAADASVQGPATSFDLAVDEHTLAVLEREARRQGASVGEVIAHSVLLYLAEVDRLTPPGSRRAT